MGKYSDWKGTIAAIGEVVSALLKSSRNPNPRFTEQQALELRSIANSGTTETFALYPACEEYWDRFPSAGVEVIGELFKELHVLTLVRAFPSSSKAMKKYNVYSGGEMFLQIYFETLRLHRLAGGLRYHNPGDCISQTKGADIPLSTLLFSDNYGVFGYDAYGYALLPAMETFQQMMEQIEDAPYVLHFEYGRYPDEINLTVNKELLSPIYCVSRIREVCQRIAIPLKIDSKLLQQFQ